MLSWVHFPYICWVCLLNKCEISNCYCCAMTRFGIKLREKNTIIFNSDLKSVSVLSNVDRKYYQCIPKKELGVQISKRRCYCITVNQVVVWPMSIRPTVLNTKKEYGMIICVPQKKEEMTRTTSRQDIA
jgi:hypothetical protein